MVLSVVLPRVRTLRQVRLDDTAKVLKKVDKERKARSPRAANGSRNSGDFSTPGSAPRLGSSPGAGGDEEARRKHRGGSLMSKFSFSRKGGSSPSSPSPKHN
jgi:hypothetical protein